MARELVPHKREGFVGYYAKGLLSLVETTQGRVLFLIALVGVVVSGFTLPPLATSGIVAVGVVVSLLRGAWVQNQALKEELAVITSARPKVRVEADMRNPKVTNIYGRTWEWGLRVHNDGATATFSAFVEVVGEGKSPSLRNKPGRHQLVWARNGKTTTVLMSGADDFLLLGFAQFLISTNEPTRLVVHYFDQKKNLHEDCWESMYIVQQGHEFPKVSKDDVFAVLEVRIVSEPAMIDAPQVIHLQFGPRDLTLTTHPAQLAPSMRNIEVRL